MDYKKMSKAELINELESLKSRLEVAGVSGKSKDTAGRKKAEEDIRGLAKFPSENPNPVMRVFNDGNILYHNKASTFLLDTWGCRTTKILPDNYMKIVSEVLHSGLSSVAETECSRGRVISLTFAPVIEEGYVNIYGMDITERKQMEEKLNKTILRTALDGFWIIDIQGRILEVNDAYCNLIGYSREELLKMRISDVEALEGPEATRKHIQQIIKAGGDRFESKHRGKDGRVIDIEVSTNYLNIKGGRIFSFIRDITERKQVEKELRQYEHIVSCSTDLLALLDKRFIYLAVNQAYLEALKKTSKEVIGHTPSEVFGEEFFNTVIKSNAERALAGEEIHYQEWFEYPAYERRYMDITYYPYFDENNKVMGFVVNGRNITERKMAEELLQEQKRALEQKNIALSEILGQIEIEKKQIKDNVITNAENLLLPIIQKLKLTGESRKYVQLLQKNLEELTSSFGTKLTGKRVKLTSREIEICDMIKNGLTNKEIASLLNISLATIERHRANIRKKFGIIKKDINLSSFLKTL